MAAALLVALPVLVIARPESPAVATTISSVPGGPVILDGNDPGDHVGPSVTSYVRNVYANLDANIAAGYSHNGKVAVIGPCRSVLTAIAPPGETFDEFGTVAAIQAFFSTIGTNNYKIIHICDNDESNVAINLTPPLQTELAKWGTAIATHVNRGGGLFSTGHNYAWLTSLFPTLVVTPGGTGQSYVTTAGNQFFPTLPVNTQVVAVNHYTFSSVPSFLQTLLTENPNSGGLIVAIGGVTVRFPQISLVGPSVSDVGLTEIYTLTAATADGTVLANNTFSYTITPVSGPPVSGTGTTDANGNYVFSLSPGSRGTTSISVQMTFSGGLAAGASTTTTWRSLASAPTLTAAADVAGQPTQVALSWNAPATAGSTPVTDYLIQQSVDGVTWTTVPHGASTATSYTVTGLSASGIYDFRVAAVNSDGPGPWSNVMTNPVPAAQAITFPTPAAVAVNAGPVTLTATADSGLPVSYTSNSPSVCTVAGSSVTLVGAGTCSITASRAATRTFAVATPVTRTFAVAPLAPIATPAAATTTGVATTPQTTVVAVPAGGSIVLLDAAGTPVSLVSVAGQGTYALDAATGTITFVPVDGFIGTATPVTFRITDVYSQTATSTYTPTVIAGVAAVAATSTGAVGAAQSTMVVVPAGGSIALVDAAGRAVSQVRIPGQGTYRLDAATGVITFVPLPDFVGTAAPVSFRVTASGSAVTSTYTATVTPVGTPLVGSVRAPALTVANGPRKTVPVLCTLKSAQVQRCDVTFWATVSGRSVIVGRGFAIVPARVGTRTVRVNVTLNALGRALAAQLGGVPVRATAAITPRGSRVLVQVATATRVVAQAFRLPRPVFFDSGKSLIKPSERRYLDGLRTRLAGVKSIDCSGYTDAMDTKGFNRKLGLARAKKVCAYLVSGTRIVVRSITLGEERPQATNVTPTGRALNRRTEIKLNY